MSAGDKRECFAKDSLLDAGNTGNTGVKSMSTDIRKLVRSDREGYRNLRLRAFQESPFSFSESYEDEHQESLEFFNSLLGNNSEHFTLGCFSAKRELIGIATFKRDQRRKARHKSYVHTMYVAPEFRGKGIAHRLLESLVNSAREMHGLEQIHLWVLNPESSPARRLYKKAGFKPQGLVVRKDLLILDQYVDAEYMTLELN